MRSADVSFTYTNPEEEMLGENFDMNALLEQAQALQQQLMVAQQEQAARTFTGQAADLVTIEVTGAGDISMLTIKPEACDPQDTEGLADLVIAAYRQAKAQADASAQASMPKIPGLPS